MMDPNDYREIGEIIPNASMAGFMPIGPIFGVAPTKAYEHIPSGAIVTDPERHAEYIYRDYDGK